MRRVLCLTACLLVGACETTEDAPLPADAVIYDASAETRAATGIAKWGYQAKRDGSTVFRGYGAHNETIATLRHSFRITSAFTRRFEMKMSSPEGSSSVLIDYESQWQEQTQTARYVAHVLENTVPRTGLAARILDRVAPDARTIPDSAILEVKAPGIATSTRPLDDGSLVGGPPKLTGTCPCQLTQNAADAAASTASTCARVGTANATTTAPATLRPLDTRAPLPLDLVVGDNGLEVDSRWDGNYNVVDNNCHDAADANIDKKTGYISCVPDTVTTVDSGHALNWTADPTKPGKAGAYCLYNGEMDGKALVNGAGCCWEGAADAKGAPLIAAGEARACVDTMCTLQYPGQAPQAHPLGERPGVREDCNMTTSTLVTCNACCKQTADTAFADWALDPTWGEYFQENIADYRKRCATDCTGVELTRGAPNRPGAVRTRSVGGTLQPLDISGPADVDATKCLATGLWAAGAQNEAAALPNVE